MGAGYGAVLFFQRRIRSTKSTQEFLGGQGARARVHGAVHEQACPTPTFGYSVGRDFPFHSQSLGNRKKIAEHSSAYFPLVRYVQTLRYATREGGQALSKNEWRINKSESRMMQPRQTGLRFEYDSYLTGKYIKPTLKTDPTSDGRSDTHHTSSNNGHPASGAVLLIRL